MIVNALSRSYNNIENRIVSPATIIDPLSRQELQTFGIWDTGATNSVITKKAVQFSKTLAGQVWLWQRKII